MAWGHVLGLEAYDSKGDRMAVSLENLTYFVRTSSKSTSRGNAERNPAGGQFLLVNES